MKLIDKSALVAEIENYKNSVGEDGEHCSSVVGRHKGQRMASEHFLSFINTLDVKEVDLDKQAEWIANGIMIAVQSAKLHTNVYNPDRKDYDHSHLMQAARRGIELGLKIAQKGEEV